MNKIQIYLCKYLQLLLVFELNFINVINKRKLNVKHENYSITKHEKPIFHQFKTATANDTTF
jgi:hypothetical protein